MEELVPTARDATAPRNRQLRGTAMIANLIIILLGTTALSLAARRLCGIDD